MNTEFTKRVIVVVWHWDKAEQSAMTEDWDCWQSPEGKLFVRASCPNDDKSCELLSTISKQLLNPDSAILFLLHESTPHYFDDAFRKALLKKLELPSSRLRVRLFGGRRGPIYLANSELGVLGVEGNFPVWYNVPLPDGRIDRKRSDFVLNHERKLLNDKHLDYLWMCYWNTPKDIIRRLAENFEWWMMGYEAQLRKPESNLCEYLCLEPVLWHKLAQFAQREDLGYDRDLLQNYAEYRAVNHCLHLKSRDQDSIANQILELSNYVGGVMNTANKESISDLNDVTYIHRSLTNIADAIPSNIL